MRFFYSCLYSFAWCLALPWVLLRLWLRGRREAGYRQHIAERFGFYKMARPAHPVIWIHAVSVGETRAAEPIVNALLDAYPQYSLLLTHMTPTGRATGQALFATYAPRVMQCYLPYDLNWPIARFIRHFAPRVCLLMETEVWPNLIAQCNQHQIPVALINARLSERSFAKGLRFAGLMRQAAQGLTCAAAQTPADAERLQLLGVRTLHVTGNVKFDVAPPPALLTQGAALRRQLGLRPVLLCASTREGEEALILDALKQRKMDDAQIDDALLVIVPRHPQRFNEVEKMIKGHGLAMQRRSQLGEQMLDPQVRVLLGDSMGEMFAYYAACDIAFIGGSLLPLGGQNLIEACALGKPVLIGPHTFNFNTISEEAVQAGAAYRVTDAADMWSRAQHLLQAEVQRRAMGHQAEAFAQHHRGATLRTMQVLRSLMV